MHALLSLAQLCIS